MHIVYCEPSPPMKIHAFGFALLSCALLSFCTGQLAPGLIPVFEDLGEPFFIYGSDAFGLDPPFYNLTMRVSIQNPANPEEIGVCYDVCLF